MTCAAARVYWKLRGCVAHSLCQVAVFMHHNSLGEHALRTTLWSRLEIKSQWWILNGLVQNTRSRICFLHTHKFLRLLLDKLHKVPFICCRFSLAITTACPALTPTLPPHPENSRCSQHSRFNGLKYVPKGSLTSRHTYMPTRTHTLKLNGSME